MSEREPYAAPVMSSAPPDDTDELVRLANEYGLDPQAVARTAAALTRAISSGKNGKLSDLF